MNLESKVGLFVVLAIVSLLVLSTRIQTVSYIGKEGYRVFVDVSNASGLEENAKVKINGVEIGYIEKISLAKANARLKLFIFNGHEIAQDSTVLISQESLLGGKYIDIIYGKSEAILKEGEHLSNYKTFASIEETSQKIYEAADEFKRLMKNFNTALNPETIEDFKVAIKNFRVMAEKISVAADEFKITGETVNKRLPNIMKQIDSLSAEFDTTGKTINKRLPDIMKQIDNLTAEFDTTGQTLNTKLPKLMDEFTAVAEDLQKLVKDNERDLNEALVSADGFFQSGKSAFDGIDSLVSKVDKAELSIGLRGESLVEDSITKTYLSASYRPNPSNYYMLDIVSGNKIDTLDANNQPIVPSTHEEGDSFISAQMGKRYENILLRAGIIENTGGLGFDYFAHADRLKASLEVFDFSAVNDIRGDSPHGKFSLRFSPYRHINLFTGYDNFLNRESANFFVGAGVEFVDDDLRDLVISSGAAGGMVGN